ncbi:hypothetical protein PLANPX_1819 [Lacipirellula parvula]|uniref:Uncharacterized protein n=1 Tax=Lacipirellula parvula TaxID=2650471 RepID=A0A5K7X8M3_9BACT|nr:hypothetical protein PLANPX_1819 [Lacipirellula parvula]
MRLILPAARALASPRQRDLLAFRTISLPGARFITGKVAAVAPLSHFSPKSPQLG